MHVHLVTIKISIVGTSSRHVETKGRVRQNHHAMRHHRSLVEGRLTIEQHNVAVDQVAVDHVALADVDGLGVHIAKTDRPLI